MTTDATNVRHLTFGHPRALNGIAPRRWTRGIAPSPTTRSCSARRTVRSTRIGFIGWVGPKSYVVSVGSNTTHEEQAAM